MKSLTLKVTALAVLSLLFAVAPAMAQNSLPAGATAVQPAVAQYSVIPISATAAVNNQVTLTIPAPPAGLSNYVCFLSFHASQDGTATAQTNAVTTSTNFNSQAFKYSLTATATTNYDEKITYGTPATGCAKSTSPATATTFVSPVAGANIAFTWNATYFQAP